MKNLIITSIIILLSLPVLAQNTLKLAVAGLSHGHVDWIFNRKDKGDVQLVGIYETNQELINRYAERYDIDRSLFFTDLDQMLDSVQPDAVSAFGASWNFLYSVFAGPSTSFNAYLRSGPNDTLNFKASSCTIL